MNTKEIKLTSAIEHAINFLTKQLKSYSDKVKINYETINDKEIIYVYTDNPEIVPSTYAGYEVCVLDYLQYLCKKTKNNWSE